MTVISRLKNKKAAGLDEVSVDLIREIAPEIAPVLAALFNRSVTCGVFPACLKTSKVIPVYKKGDKFNVANYRQVAVSSVFSKILERAMSDRLVGYLERFSVVHEFQHGFRRGFSTETATTAVTQFIMDCMEREHVLAILFDLSRAFDTIEPEIMKTKLDAIGVRGPVNRWIISYLTDRKITVKVSDSYSELHSISTGTPQGGILGPLLFSLYVNDMPEYVTGGKLFAYADDTTVVVRGSTYAEVQGRANGVLAQFDEWCKRNRLVVNYGKTKCVGFRWRGDHEISPYNLAFGDDLLRCEPFVKFLGTYIDHHMDWSRNCDEIVAKLNRSFYVMLNLKSYLTIDSLMRVYYGTVQSVLSYNIIVWGQATDVGRVFVAQKRILRVIFNIGSRETCRGIFRQKGLFTVVSLFLFKLLSRVHLRRATLPRHHDFHEYNTRNREHIRLPLIIRSSCKRSPDYAGGGLYNKLPSSLKKLNTKVFQKRLKEMLIEGAFYTTSEFEASLSSSQ